jgi:competence protein ComEC
LLVGCWVLAPGLTRWAIVGRGAMLAAAGSWWLVVYDLRGRGAADGALGLFFLDVGQGDAAAIRTPGGHWVLVDAGPADERRDAGHRIVGPWLRRAGARRLDALVVSHAHADHLGGAGAVLAQVPADVVLEPASPTDDARYLRFLGQVAASGVRWQPARSAMGFTLDGVQFRFVHPDTAWTEWGLDLNEDSAVLLVEYGAFRALFAGDAGLPAEARLRGRVGDVDLLKVGHHGSRGASGDAWLSELRPEFAVISVGRGNRYGHPAPEALARLRAAHARIMRTDEEGTITVVTDGREQMTVTGRSGTVHRALRAPVRSP